MTLRLAILTQSVLSPSKLWALDIGPSVGSTHLEPANFSTTDPFSTPKQDHKLDTGKSVHLEFVQKSNQKNYNESNSGNIKNKE